MLFNSAEFLIFFPIVVALFFALPQRYRWVLLLAASYYFYIAWKAEYVVLIMLSTLVDYFAGRQMAQIADRSRRKKYLILSLGIHLSILFAFKYFNFFSDSLRALFTSLELTYPVPVFRALLPVGISFYTFKSLSYIIDIYRGIKQPETHLGIFALYVSFFPQLISGPIDRSERMIPQLKRAQFWDWARIGEGLRRMGWGYFKKLVIADRLAVLVNTVYDSPGDFTGVPLILATYFFAFQIYCDFSGYSDIAIGAARVMGYDLTENFQRPYFSRSIGEFWRRWHITLSTWFRDYLYIPLGGNRVSDGRKAANLMIVFLVSGLWHGAAWTFVIWGGLHGLYLVTSQATARWRAGLAERLHLARFSRLTGALSLLITFHLVTFAWIFFRANSLGDALYIAGHLFTGLELQAGYGFGLGLYDLAIVLLAILVMEGSHLFEHRTGAVWTYLRSWPRWLRWATDYALIFAVLLFGRMGVTEFIYFQF
ncbi:MAG TPA: MBOAT family protein [Anaerolineaceae bacterium]|nr:MBOAT family protein [Anaerolineaceae bacterium]